MDEQRVEAVQRHAIPGSARFAQADAGTLGQIGVEPVDRPPEQVGQTGLKPLGKGGGRGCYKSDSHGFSRDCFPESEGGLKKLSNPASESMVMRLRSSWLLAVWEASEPAIVPWA
jgi:hypothetical protein